MGQEEKRTLEGGGGGWGPGRNVLFHEYHHSKNPPYTYRKGESNRWRRRGVLLGRRKPLREGPTISYARRSEGQEGRPATAMVERRGMGQGSETPSAVDWLDYIFLRTVPCEQTRVDHGRWNQHTRKLCARFPLTAGRPMKRAGRPRVPVKMTDSLERMFQTSDAFVVIGSK